MIYRALQRREVDVELQYLDTDHYWRESTDFETSYQNLRQDIDSPLRQSVYDSIVAWLATTANPGV